MAASSPALAAPPGQSTNGARQSRAGDEQRDAGVGAAGAADAALAITEADRLFHVVATRTAAAPLIDARLDDEAWVAARILTDFVQATPDEGAPASQRTEVRVVFDDDNVYIAAVLYETDPGAIIANVLKRDQQHTNNDSFTVTLDTYHDHRNGFYFETNAMGAKLEAQIIGEGGTSMVARILGEGFNPDWDAVWDVEATITDEGWIVEIAIPFWSLRFTPDEMDAWGINFRRTVRRRSEQSYWAPIPRQYDATRLSLSGMVTGLQAPRSRNLQIKPYALGNAGKAVNDVASGAGGFEYDNDLGGQLGLDLKWGITPNMTLDGTVNPDFAQVEADSQQVNLTRFSLFFPEKREFFLENAGLFDFGTGAGLSRAGTGGSMVGFHSRRIGISETNEEIPLYGGARLTGKIGRWSIGGLSMQSQPTDELSAENYTVARVRRDLGERSNVGVLFTNRQVTGDDYNRELGVDGRWAINSQTTIDAWWMKTETPGLEGEDAAGQVRFDWGTPLWQVDGSILQVGKNYNPELGFVNRTDIRSTTGTVHWTPYPDWPGIRNFSPHANLFYTTDTDGRLLSRFLHLDWDTFLTRGDKLSVAYNRRFEHNDLPFEIAPDVIIPIGDYSYNDVEIELASDPSRVLSANLKYRFGSFWSGDADRVDLGFAGRIGARFDAGVTWVHNDVKLPEGAFITDLAITRLNFDFSTTMSLAGLIQYNSQADQALVNIRLRFIYQPLSDIFVVYNERRVAEDSDLIDRAIIFKITRLMRF